ncbi:transporter substrate-binding domain-containing protein [Zooshikella marina]|uniref:ABC transporter substrate-binding protein n=1 Tax=Zooshikella ganghwensis TaxID=202772 RepID=A0A4P9VLD5_9GAMM|nr:transporter substrate-binding domain-containing protein [Zooshikella ganghwensis]MBU2706853.1 transporter substrate-binding domain-containing protein [Zooshikella ganghwensis]RDH43606.1 ABC transporter substrate-binding protein [Zooshikella ganghwensis]
MTAYLTGLIALFLTLSLHAKELLVVTEEWPPYNYKKNDLITGYSTEIVRNVLEKANINYTIRLYPWARAYDLALKNENVLIYTIVRTPERESLFQWLGPILPGKKFYLYKLKHRKDISLTTIDDAKNFKTAIMRDDVTHQFLNARGFEDEKHLDLSVSEEINIKKLFNDRVDLIIGNEESLPIRIKNLQLDFSKVEPAIFMFEHGYYMALSAQTDERLFNQLNNAMKQVFTPKFQQTLAEKYQVKLLFPTSEN